MSLYFIKGCLGISLVLVFGFHGRPIMYVRLVSVFGLCQSAFSLGTE